jgi:hypothetical protein
VIALTNNSRKALGANLFKIEKELVIQFSWGDI